MYSNYSCNNFIYRKYFIIDKMMCSICEEDYIWSSQNYQRICMGFYFVKTRNMACTGKTSDIFTEHFTKHMYLKNLSTKDVHNICEFEILREGNLLNLTKRLCTKNCSLCLQQKVYIVRRSKKSTHTNFWKKISEIEGTCRHRTSRDGL